jgi:hypothetical protein
MNIYIQPGNFTSYDYTTTKDKMEETFRIERLESYNVALEDRDSFIDIVIRSDFKHITIEAKSYSVFLWASYLGGLLRALTAVVTVLVGFISRPHFYNSALGSLF